LTVDIALHGTRHAVAARRDGDRWIVTLDGRELGVDVVDVGGRWSMLISPDVVSGVSRTDIGPASRSYEIVFEPREAGGQVVFVNGDAFPLTVADARAAFARRSPGAETGGAVGAAAVVAPMPGRVVKVLVAPGDAVAARQPVVIVEAMKMENELRAPRAGTVASVLVSEGQSVEAHAVLVELT
jgi:biotin carboxyl carrier protein